jgi:hypothetical protein
MGLGHYILGDDGEPQLVTVWSGGQMNREALMTWATWFETAVRQVLRETIGHEGGTVSTVFLGLDHNYGSGPPVLWETMVFGGPFDGHQWRASSGLASLQQHVLAVSLIETYRSAPRKTKKAMRGYAQQSMDWPRKPRERRRLERALARVGA